MLLTTQRSHRWVFNIHRRWKCMESLRAYHYGIRYSLYTLRSILVHAGQDRYFTILCDFADFIKFACISSFISSCTNTCNISGTMLWRHIFLLANNWRIKFKLTLSIEVKRSTSIKRTKAIKTKCYNFPVLKKMCCVDQKMILKIRLHFIQRKKWMRHIIVELPSSQSKVTSND